MYCSLIATVAKHITALVIILGFAFMLLAGTFCLCALYMSESDWLSVNIIIIFCIHLYCMLYLNVHICHLLYLYCFSFISISQIYHCACSLSLFLYEDQVHR